MKRAPTVLLVDDDAAVRLSIGRVLRAEAIQVVLARGVKDALEHIARQTPSLVLTDMCMGPLAGWDLIAHLRNHHPDLPIFVISAIPSPLGHEGIRPTEAYFQKPLDLDVLVAAIRRQLSIAEAGKSVARSRS